MATYATTQRLAALVTDALELGSGKYERDVADDLFRAFGIDLAAVQTRVPRLRRKSAFRDEAAAALAAAAPSPEALMAEVVRCGGRFVAMVEEIYALLADHVATSTGSAEQFRLRRDDVDLEITISPAFIERLRELESITRRVSVGRINHDAMRRFVGWDNGAFYGTWPLDGGNLRLLDTVLHLDSLGAAAAEARPAAEQLVATAESLLEAHMANLAALKDDDVHALFASLGDNDESAALQELERFRADGVLGGTAHSYSVAGLDRPTFVGLDHSGGVVVRAADELAYGSPMSGLAQFVAMWRSGMHSPRDYASSTAEDVRRACEEAAVWLREEVLTPTGSIEVEDLIERFEEFLNLPLWRGRQLLYEIWILCATLRTCRDLGWEPVLRLLRPDADEWVLDAKPTTAPVADLRNSRDRNIALEVWREPQRLTATGQVTPDVTIATPGDHPRDLVVIEAKDRYGMRLEAVDSDRSAFGVARKYRDALHANATWVCNHCDFREGDADATTNYGDDWSRIHLAAPFRPGSIPAAFGESLDAALVPPGGVQPEPVDRLVLAIDVTASMDGRLPPAWDLLRGLDEGRFAELRAVLFSDHGEQEPYLLRDIGPCATVADLQQRVDAEPSGHGGDPEEALEDAMRRCRELAEELGHVTVLVLTDAPPHSPDACPLGIDFDAEVRRLLETGSRCLVSDDWRPGADTSWSAFAGSERFRDASLAQLIEYLNA
jgi:hypothetical protein